MLNYLVRVTHKLLSELRPPDVTILEGLSFYTAGCAAFLTTRRKQNFALTELDMEPKVKIILLK